MNLPGVLRTGSELGPRTWTVFKSPTLSPSGQLPSASGELADRPARERHEEGRPGPAPARGATTRREGLLGRRNHHAPPPRDRLADRAEVRRAVHERHP